MVITIKTHQSTFKTYLNDSNMIFDYAIKQSVIHQQPPRIENNAITKKSTLKVNGLYVKRYTKEQERIKRLIGRNIRKARMENHLSLQRVADEIGYSKSKLSEIENGKKEAGSVLLHQLADLFLVSPNYFHEGINPDIDLDEDVFFNFSSICKQVWETQTKSYAKACFEILQLSYDSEKFIENLAQAGFDLIEKSESMIASNLNGAWQEMKYGNAFNRALNIFKNKLLEAQQTQRNHLLAKKQKLYEQFTQTKLELET